MAAFRLMFGMFGLFAVLFLKDDAGSGNGGGSGDDGKGGDDAGKGAGSEGDDGGEGDDGDGDGDDDGEEFKPITTKADFDRMLKKRLERAKRQGAKEAEAAATLKAEEDKAKADGDLAKQLEIEQRKREEAERKAEETEHERLKDRIARRHELPDDLADLLKGDDEKALEAHAKQLAKYKPAGSNGNVNNDAGAGGSGGGKKKTAMPGYRIVSRGKTVRIGGEPEKE